MALQRLEVGKGGGASERKEGATSDVRGEPGEGDITKAREEESVSCQMLLKGLGDRNDINKSSFGGQMGQEAC